MTKFILFITSAPNTDIKSLDAFKFARASLKAGHCIEQVFFYADAVLTANKYLGVNNNTFNLHDAWITLAREYDLVLNVCVTASIRRGILGANEAEFHNFNQANLISPFKQVGMADYFSAIKDQHDLVSVQF